MYINNEKELEDYICKDIDGFIEDMKEAVWGYRKQDIKFLGRQVRIGGQIADLVFYYDGEDGPDENTRWLVRTFIIVELKFRTCETKDLAQLSKYLNLFDALAWKHDNKLNLGEIHSEGILLGFDLDNNLQEIQMQLEGTNIHFMKLNQTIDFDRISYSLKESFIEQMQVDDRILNLFREGESDGEKKND